MVPSENSQPLGKRLNPAYHRFSNSRFCLSSQRLSVTAGGFGNSGTALRALSLGRHGGQPSKFSIWRLLPFVAQHLRVSFSVKLRAIRGGGGPGRLGWRIA